MARRLFIIENAPPRRSVTWAALIRVTFAVNVGSTYVIAGRPRAARAAASAVRKSVM
jgi:hypothetical protein